MNVKNWTIVINCTRLIQVDRGPIDISTPGQDVTTVKSIVTLTSKVRTLFSLNAILSYGVLMKMLQWPYTFHNSIPNFYRTTTIIHFNINHLLCRFFITVGREHINTSPNSHSGIIATKARTPRMKSTISNRSSPFSPSYEWNIMLMIRNPRAYPTITIYVALGLNAFKASPISSALPWPHRFWSAMSCQVMLLFSFGHVKRTAPDCKIYVFCVWNSTLQCWIYSYLGLFKQLENSREM